MSRALLHELKKWINAPGGLQTTLSEISSVSGGGGGATATDIYTPDFVQVNSTLSEIAANTALTAGATDIYTPDFATLNTTLSEISGNVEFAGATDIYGTALTLLQATLSEAAGSVEFAGATDIYTADLALLSTTLSEVAGQVDAAGATNYAQLLSILTELSLLNDITAGVETTYENVAVGTIAIADLETTVSAMANDLYGELVTIDTSLNNIEADADAIATDVAALEILGIAGNGWLDDIHNEVQNLIVEVNNQDAPISYAAYNSNLIRSYTSTASTRLSYIDTQTDRLRRNGGGNLPNHASGTISATTTVVAGAAGNTVQMRNFMITHDGAFPIQVRIKGVNDASTKAPVHFYLPASTKGAVPFKMDPSNWYFETTTSDGLEIELTGVGGAVGNVYYSVGYYSGAAESLPT